MTHITNVYDYLRFRFSADEGATATEYIVLIVFIGIAIIGGAIFFGDALNDLFRSTATALEEGTTS